MPIYDFMCKTCGEITEIFQAQRDINVVFRGCKCSDYCAHVKLMSAPSFRINGASEANGYTISKKETALEN